MFWILAFAVLLLAVAGGYTVGTRKLAAGRTPAALPEAPSPLQVRLLELDAAIADVRAAARDLPPSTLRLCAIAAQRAVTSLSITRDPSDVLPIDIRLPVEQSGPGARLFERLIAALHGIHEEDRRELEDAGLDPRRILGVINSALPPEQWVQELERTLDWFRAGIRHLPERRYG